MFSDFALEVFPNNLKKNLGRVVKIAFYESRAEFWGQNFYLNIFLIFQSFWSLNESFREFGA